MMLIAFGIYTLFLAFIWGLFLVVRINFFKFRQYSAAIIPMTRILTLILLVGTILGYLLLAKYFFFGGSSPDTQNFEHAATEEQIF